MSNARTASVDIKSSQLYTDGSGFPAVVQCGPYVYSADFIGGEVRMSLIRPVSGSRTESKIAADRCRRAYAAMVAEKTDAAWVEANRVMYAA
jgi:hypothetical protein